MLGGYSVIVKFINVIKYYFTIVYVEDFYLQIVFLPYNKVRKKANETTKKKGRKMNTKTTEQKKSKRIRVHKYPLKGGIKRSPKFAEKGLAEFAVNVGTKCGHDCKYCSTGAMLRMHQSFKAAGENPFGHGYAIIDPDMPERVAQDAARIKNRGMVQICTTVDAWSPEAQEYNLGRRCLEAILAQPGWTVRILTKNAAVAKDFDFIKKHRDRVLIGLSLTGASSKSGPVSITEPNASPIPERMDMLARASGMGLRVYGMLCPLLPGIADSPEDIESLVHFCKQLGAEEIFAENVNSRGPGLRLTEEALRANGFPAEADAVHLVRRQKNWSPYVSKLLADIQKAMRQHKMIGKLRYLLYPNRLLVDDRKAIEKDDEGVVWL